MASAKFEPCTDSCKSGGNVIEHYMEAFGCHLTWRELEHIDTLTLMREEDILAKDDWDFNTRPTYFTAVRNLQGFVAYRLKEESNHDPMDFFQEVLENDQNNINALGNMHCIAMENEMFKTAQEYKTRLQDIFNGRSSNYEHRARAYADRAHAIRYFEQDKRCFHYMEYIERACVIGSSCLTPHRAEWFFDLALALYRRDVQMLYLRKLWSENGRAATDDAADHDIGLLNEKIRAGFIKAANCFYDVVRISESLDIKALSWVFLGILLNHDSSQRNYADVFTDGSHPLHRVDANVCFQKGEYFGANYAIALRRIGSEYVKLGKFDKAEDLLRKSLQLCESWFAYRYTGIMYLKKFEKTNTDGSPNKEYLKEAERWFKKALKFKKVHADHSDLGHVYFLLGDYTKAIQHFKWATNTDQDDYCDLVVTHKRWAKCLEAKGEFAGQREQKAKAYELQNKLHEPLASKDDFFRDDFEFYNTPTKPGFVRILLETHIWCTHSQQKAAENWNPMDIQNIKGKIKYDFFVSYAERDRRWAFAFLHKLESEHRLRGCINHRDFIVGVDEGVNRVNAIKSSDKCVVILTPAYVADDPTEDVEEWTSYELAQAVTESRKRKGYIIPLMLRPCSPPETIEHLTYRECCDGQIAQHHWNELVKQLSKHL